MDVGELERQERLNKWIPIAVDQKLRLEAMKLAIENSRGTMANNLVQEAEIIRKFLAGEKNER